VLFIMITSLHGLRHRRPLLVSRALRAGHVAIADMCVSFLLISRAFCSEHAEQACRYLADVRREAGRCEVESQDYADSRVPYPQARVPAQQENHHAQGENYRQGYRQPITSLRLNPCAPVFAIRCGRAMTCGASSGTARCTSRRRPCRPWPARRKGTPGRAGSRSGDVSALSPPHMPMLSLLPGNSGVCSTTAPVYPSYRGAACSLAGRHCLIRVG
jgi:hypothetical protein